MTGAEEGAHEGAKTSISTRSRRELWSLDQTGNFVTNQYSLNGDSDFADFGETDDLRTHNSVNEIATWRPGGSGGGTLTVTSDSVGNMIGDGRDYDYKYDVWGRLVKVYRQGTSDLVAEYTYNGLGYRIGWRYDMNGSGSMNGSDPWEYLAYDERWRVVATFREDDSSPKDRFVYHAAGLNGMGGSSYIDSMAWRDRDANSAGVNVADETLKERRYYAQNWRAELSSRS